MILNFCPVFAAAGAYYAFEQSDLPGKTIVILLFFGSILTWTIMLEKGMSLYRAKKASELFIKLFRGKTSTVALFREAQRDPSPIAKIYVSAVEKLLDFYSISPEQTSIPGISATHNKKLTTAQIEALRTVLEREVSDQILVLEERIGLLATAVSLSPLLGLFGTVWGIMIAFCGLASQGRAEMSALAPGVSGALLTTVVGLLVAMPSLIGYNLLTLNIRKVTVYMDNFAEEFIAKINLEQLDAEEQG